MADSLNNTLGHSRGHFAEKAEELVQTVQELYAAGLITPTGGNLSVRLPGRQPPGEGGPAFLITPSGMHKGSLRAESMIPLDAAGRVASAVVPAAAAANAMAKANATANATVNANTKAKAKPSIETPMHLRIYQLRPECNAVIHTHAPAATLLGMAGVMIKPITLDAVRFLGAPVVPFEIPGSPELVEAVEVGLRAAPAGVPAILLQNHGLVTFGASLREAANYALALEEVCRLLLEAQGLGRELSLIPAKAITYLREHHIV